MIATIVAWVAGGLLVLAYLRWHDRRREGAMRRREAAVRAETARLLAEIDRLADDPSPADPLDAIEAEIDYLRDLVADLRRERAASPGGPALAN